MSPVSVVEGAGQSCPQASVGDPRPLDSSCFPPSCPCAMFLIPTLGPVAAQEAPQQISSGFSRGPDIKGAKGRGGKRQRSRDVGQQTLAPDVRGLGGGGAKAEQEMRRMEGSENSRATETESLLSIKATSHRSPSSNNEEGKLDDYENDEVERVVHYPEGWQLDLCLPHSTYCAWKKILTGQYVIDVR
ncbi:unnamed protein product [Pleuronectes platessa]|uniref:Uncharacterized protein n=1 Tax=Pleuronectes platessa TaxID=8262 RepID=A0A9N7VEL4_PLEPL|nr:unnamed protein product [Pleuronectes platessa]